MRHTALTVVEVATTTRCSKHQVHCNRLDLLVYQGDTEQAFHNSEEIAPTVALAKQQFFLTGRAAHNHGFIPSTAAAS